MELESSYPYVAKTRSCQAKKSKGVVQVASHAAVKHNNVRALKAAITAGPTCVAIDAANNYFQGYSGGILNNCGGGNNLDHAVTAVGYGTEGGVLYAIVRNSWTASWGESGYIRMALKAQGKEGVCGILMDPTTVKTH
jgi:C1A family cysteine protease